MHFRLNCYRGELVRAGECATALPIVQEEIKDTHGFQREGLINLHNNCTRSRHKHGMPLPDPREDYSEFAFMGVPIGPPPYWSPRPLARLPDRIVATGFMPGTCADGDLIVGSTRSLRNKSSSPNQNLAAWRLRESHLRGISTPTGPHSIA